MLDILLNPHAIAIDQSWAGHGGDFVTSLNGSVAVWAKPLPEGGVGVVLFRNSVVGPATVSVAFALASLPSVFFAPVAGASCEVLDVWANSSSTVAVLGKAENYRLRHRQALLLKVGDCKQQLIKTE
jgi:hypothetical protein